MSKSEQLQTRREKKDARKHIEAFMLSQNGKIIEINKIINYVTGLLQYDTRVTTEKYI